MPRRSRSRSSIDSLHRRCLVGAVDRNINRRDVLIAGDAALHRLQRHEDDVVLILAEAGIALRRQDADDGTGNLANADSGADRISALEKRGGGGGAEDADGAAGADLAVGEGTPAGDGPIAGDEVAVVGAGHLLRVIEVAVDGGEIARHDRRGDGDALHLGPDGVDVLDGEIAASRGGARRTRARLTRRGPSGCWSRAWRHRR